MFHKSYKQTFSLVIAVLSIFMIFFGTSIIYAQESTPTPTPTPDNRVELMGEIQAMDVDTITISGQIIDLTMAEINTALEIGTVVKVQGWLLEDGTILAREVNDPNDDDQADDTLTDEVEIVGVLSAYEGTTMTIAGQVVDVSEAEIKTGVEVDEYVKAHGTIVDGVWVAHEVEPAQEDDLNFDNANDNNDDNGNDNDNNDDNGNDNAIVLPPNCVATQPTGWTTYTIKAGDTLSSIADRADSSISELAITNCIADPRFIVAGMTIFVPHQPSPIVDNSNNNTNDNNDDNSNDNHDDNSNDNHDNGNDDHGNDNHGGNDDNSNDNGDDD